MSICAIRRDQEKLPPPLDANDEGDLVSVGRDRGRGGNGAVAALPQLRPGALLELPEPGRTALGREIEQVIGAETGARGECGRQSDMADLGFLHDPIRDRSRPQASRGIGHGRDEVPAVPAHRH